MLTDQIDQEYVDSNLLRAVIDGNFEGVKITIEELGANVNTDVLKGSSTIHLLSKNNRLNNDHIKILRYLIDQGADINKKNSSDQTPLEVAIKIFNPPVTSELLKNCPDISLIKDFKLFKYIIKANYNSEIPLKAQIRNIFNIHNVYLNDFCDNGYAAAFLEEELAKRSLDVIKYCLDDSTEIEESETLLRTWPSKPSTELRSRLELGLEILKARQGHISSKDSLVKNYDIEQHYYGQDPNNVLHYSIEIRDLNLAKYLLEQKRADINSLDEKGETAFEKILMQGWRDGVRVSLQYKPTLGFLKENKNLDTKQKAELLQLIQQELLYSLVKLEPYVQSFCFDQLWTTYEEDLENRVINKLFEELGKQEELFFKMLPIYFNNKFQVGYKCEQEKIKDIAYLSNLEKCSEVAGPLSKLLLNVGQNMGTMFKNNIFKNFDMPIDVVEAISSYLDLKEQANAISLIKMPVTPVSQEDAVEKLEKIAEQLGEISLGEAT